MRKLYEQCEFALYVLAEAAGALSFVLSTGLISGVLSAGPSKPGELTQPWSYGRRALLGLLFLLPAGIWLYKKYCDWEVTHQ